MGGKVDKYLEAYREKDSDAESIWTVEIASTAKTPTDGNILVYRSATNHWVLEAKPAGGSNPALNDLTDVSISSVTDNELLAYNSATGEWINQTPSEANVATAGHTHTEADIVDLDHYDSSDFDTDFATKTTDDLAEGSTNLYYTDTRVSSNADVASNTAKRHDPVTVTDSSTINFTLNGQDITGDVIQSGIDHGSISGLGDDDHPQYHTDARGDARYYTQTQLDNGQLDSRYYTESEVDSLLAAQDELNELNDVDLASVSNGELLVYVSSVDKWENKTISEAGIASSSHTHDASDITSGTFDDARIAESNVTQHESAIDHNNLLNTHNLTTDIDHTQIANRGSYTHAQIDSHIDDVDKHREIDDTSTATTDLWSANKINTELSGKSDVGHTHDDRYYTESETDALLADKADDDSVVHTTGDETVGGVKTFTSFPITPSSDPTTDYQVANKKYVDAQVGGVDELSELNDVTISSPGDNEVLAYNSATGEWINQTAAEANLSVVGHTHHESDIVDLDHYDSSDFDNDFATKTTDDLTEGSTNLYYTDARVSSNSDVASNTAKRHDPVTVSDSSTIDFTLTGQEITADVITSGIDHGELAGLSDNDHPQYPLKDDHETITKRWTFSSTMEVATVYFDETTAHFRTSYIQNIGGPTYYGNYYLKGDNGNLYLTGTRDTATPTFCVEMNIHTQGLYTTDDILFSNTSIKVGDVENGNLVDKTASETITGEWTYNTFPLTPTTAPTTDYQVANKKYVDDNIVTDHGALSGLSDDDHPQYHNDARGDARYYTQTQLDGGQLDSRYYTESEVDSLLDAQDELSELNDTSISGVSDGELLIYEASTSKWVNKTLSEAGVSSSSHTHTAHEISVGTVGASTYDDVQDVFDTINSSGKISGGEFTDNGDGTIDVAAGTGVIRATDDSTAPLMFFDWPAKSSLSLTDNSANYVYVSYNGGSPTVTVSTSISSDKNTNVLLGMVYREGTDLYEVSAGQVVNNCFNAIFWKDVTIHGKFQRASGLMISEKTDRKFALTAGAYYAGLTKKSLAAFDSSGTDTFTYVYRDGSGGHTKVTGQTQIDNLHYDDGSGTLAELTSGGWFGADRYGVHWVYESVDGDVFVVYGVGDYTLTQAQEAQPPSDIPGLLDEAAGLVGKIIIQKNASSFTSCQSAFAVIFSPSAVTAHNELSGLQGGTTDEYYHLTEAEHNRISEWDNAVHITGAETITGLKTFDAGLKLNDDDKLSFSSFTDVFYKSADDVIEWDFGNISTNNKTLMKFRWNYYYSSSWYDIDAYGDAVELRAVGSDANKSEWKAANFRIDDNTGRLYIGTKFSMDASNFNATGMYYFTASTGYQFRTTNTSSNVVVFKFVDRSYNLIFGIYSQPYIAIGGDMRIAAGAGDVKFGSDTDTYSFYEGYIQAGFQVGRLRVKTVSVSSNHTLTDKEGVCLVDASGGAVTITLPAPNSTGENAQHVIKKVDSSSNAVTISPNGSETIDGSSSKTLSSQWDYIVVHSDGTNWYVIG